MGKESKKTEGTEQTGTDARLGMDRRSFLTGAVATGAFAAMAGLTGCGGGEAAPADATGEGTAAVAAWNAKPASVAGQVSSTVDYDVVVVGAGNAGVPAALTIAEEGGKVVIIDQGEAPTMWAGDLDALDSKIQKDLGIEIDKEFVIKDLMRYASGKADVNLIRMWAYNAGAVIDWFQEKMQAKGLDVMVDTRTKKFYPEGFFYSPASCHTAYQPPLKETANSMGSELAIPAMVALLTEAGGTIDFGMTAVELVQDASGKVTGVIAKNGDGAYVQYNAAKSVMLATGGYLGNKDMMDQLGVVDHKFCSNHVGGGGRMGTGIQLATWAGAEIDSDHGGGLLIFDRGALPEGVDLGTQGGTTPAFWWPGSQPFLRVNAKGERFCNEDGPYDFVQHMAAMQPGHFWWQVFDDNHWDDIVRFGTTICSRLVAEEGAKNCLLLGQYFPARNKEEFDSTHLAAGLEQGAVRQADTLEELADIMGVPKDTFLATVARYNEVADAGEDLDYHKAPWRLSHLDKGPFYAAKLSGWAMCTLNGVRVNTKFQAIDADGNAIEGLRICGNDMGGFFNGNYPQYYGGLACGKTLTLARLAALDVMGKPYPVLQG